MVPGDRHEDPVVIVGAARTPFGAFGGALRDVPLPRLAAVAGAAALQRAGLDPDAVDEYLLGVNLPGSDRSIARQAALLTGVPDDRDACTGSVPRSPTVAKTLSSWTSFLASCSEVAVLYPWS